VPDVKAVAAHVTRAAGGHGAVREIVEAILRARGDWQDVLARYFSEQTAVAPAQ
jgi:3-deoxy-D-manno-octulosonate 8-phosphate phosphatase (KDO 8-P phosphatase)